MRLLTTRRFEKDLKRDRKRGKNLDTLWSVVERLLSKQPLDPRHRRHRLTGDWSPCWECHIEPDWLLVWDQENDTIILVRTGTHSEFIRLMSRRVSVGRGESPHWHTDGRIAFRRSASRGLHQQLNISTHTMGARSLCGQDENRQFAPADRACRQARLATV